MTPIADVLQPDHVLLTLSAKEPSAAIEEVLATLEGDERVRDFAALREAVYTQPAPAIAENGIGICIAHGRTELVTSLVMSAGRSVQGIVFPKLSERVKLVFVAGIPGAFTSEYLRIVGAIVRICRDKRQLDRMLSTKDPDRFVALLSSGEVKL
jgi:mannitol/fructose-specific phosphotransferase system IIA component (Ntr-type)